MNLSQVEINGFNSCVVTSFIDQKSSQESHNLENQQRFSSKLWAKITDISKRALLGNNFVYPRGLEGNYLYFETPEGTLILDLDSHLGRSRIAKTCFGQNISTNEFLAFKPISYTTKVIAPTHQEVVAMQNLKRLRGVVCRKIDEKEILYMAVELIDGVTLTEFYWNDYFKGLKPVFRLAISYLKERKFLIESKVVQSDTNCENIMVDPRREKVFIVDFGGNSVFDHRTKSFIPFPLDPLINIVDVIALERFFLSPNEVSETDPLKCSFEAFLDDLEQIKEKSTYHPQVFNITLDAVLELLEKRLNC